MKKITYAIVAILLFPSVSHTIEKPESLGKVSKIEGVVFYHLQGGVRGQILKESGQAIIAGDKLRTKADSSVYIKLIDGSRLIVKENSIIEFKGASEIKSELGKILYDITPQGKNRGLKIASKTAVIGVKGTRFAVENGEDKTVVYLKEGSIGVESVMGEFTRHLEQEMADFEKYSAEMRQGVSSMQQEFEDYKSQQNKEMIEYVKAFDMQAGQAIQIDGRDVKNITIPKDIDEAFQMLDAF